MGVNDIQTQEVKITDNTQGEDRSEIPIECKERQSHPSSETLLSVIATKGNMATYA